MISIVIPTYDRPNKVVEAVQSVQKQTLSDIEILVIDDNGRNSKAQIETEKALKDIDDERVRYIIHEENKGGCAARNTGINCAYGEYVAFLDDDDVWSEKFLETMLPFFDDDKVGAVYCEYFSYDGIYSVSLKEASGYEGNVYNDILRGWCPASTSFFLVKKSALIAAGLFDEKLRSFQDYDMWLRLSRLCEFAHCRERLVVKYEGFDEQTSKNPVRRWAGYHSVVEKYTQSLSKEELVLFQNFIDSFYYSTLLGDIVYSHAHIRWAINEYLKNSSLKRRLGLYLRLWLPKCIFAHIYSFVKTKLNDALIIHKGLYKFGGGGLQSKLIIALQSLEDIDELLRRCA